MGIIDSLTSKNIREIKPNLFIQTDPKGRSRVVYPVFVRGKFRAGNFVKRWWMFVLLMFLVWAYVHDTGELREFYDDIVHDPIKYCDGVYARLSDSEVPCTKYLAESGICDMEETTTDYSNINITLTSG